MAAAAESLPELITADKVAEAFDMTPATVYRLARERRLAHHKFSPQSIRFRREDIETWLNDTYRPAVNR